MNDLETDAPQDWFSVLAARVRFSSLLGTLVALLFVPTLLEFTGIPVDSPVGNGVFLALFFFVLLASVLAVAGSRRSVIFAATLVGVTIVVRAIMLRNDAPALQVAYLCLSLVLLAFVAWLMLGYLFRARCASFDTIAAALCVYLLMAVIWGLAYVLLDVTEPGAFRAATIPAGEIFMRLDSETSVYPFYYSLVTLTTLGYGDIVPVSKTASMLAALEAVVGQVYLTVLVARLVGLQIAGNSD